MKKDVIGLLAAILGVFLFATALTVFCPHQTQLVREAQAQYSPSIARIDSGDVSTSIRNAVQYSLKYLYGVTGGTVTARKAVVVNADRRVDSLKVTHLQGSFIDNVFSSTAAADTAYAAGTYNGPGTTFVKRPLAAKSTTLLQTGAPIGSRIRFFVADADSGRFRCAAGDSVIDMDGSADIVYGTVAGACVVEKVTATKWFITEKSGTWTASHN